MKKAVLMGVLILLASSLLAWAQEQPGQLQEQEGKQQDQNNLEIRTIESSSATSSPAPSSEQPIYIQKNPHTMVYKYPQSGFLYTEIDGIVYKVDKDTGILSPAQYLNIDDFTSLKSQNVVVHVPDFQPTDKTPWEVNVRIQTDPLTLTRLSEGRDLATITLIDPQKKVTPLGMVDSSVSNFLDDPSLYTVTIDGQPVQYDSEKRIFTFDGKEITVAKKIVVQKRVPISAPAPAPSDIDLTPLLEKAAPGAATLYENRDTYAKSMGFDPTTAVSGSEQGDVYYQKGEDFLLIRKDGTSALQIYRDNQPIYTINYEAGGGNPTLTSFEGLKGLSGSYSSHQEIVDRLYGVKAITPSQYEELNGKGWFDTEETMETVYNTVKANQEVWQEVVDKTITSFEDVPEHLKGYFDGEEDFEMFRERYRESYPQGIKVAKTAPPATAGTAPAASPAQPITVASVDSLPNGINSVTTDPSGTSVTISYDYETNKQLTAKDAIIGTIKDVEVNYNNYEFKIGDQVAIYDPSTKHFYTDNQFENGKLKSGVTLDSRIKMTANTKITVTRKSPSGAPSPATAKKAPPPKPTKSTYDRLHDREITHQQAFEELDKVAKEAEADLEASKDILKEAEKSKKAFGEKGREKGIKELKKEVKANEEKANEARRQAEAMRWQGNFLEVMTNTQEYQTIKAYGSTVGDIATGLSRLGSYQALSNALWGPETSRNWLVNADHEFFQWFANFPSFMATRTGLASEDCEIDDARVSKSDGQSSQFVQTAGGTFQFVGAIQAERSPASSPILCRRTDDPEAEEEFICSKKQVCVDGFCYADKDQDEEPDAAAPLKGYFYKITWGVTAPQDAKFTPYIDENNKSVRFNLQLNGARSIWLYSRPGAAGASVLQLSNGQSDREVLTHFSSEEPPFSQACLRYDPRYRIKDRDGTEVVDQCVDIILSTKGKVQFDSSSQTPSYTSGSEGVDQNADW